MNFPKVLIATPTSKVKDYCANAWIDNVRGFDYPNFDALVVDNSYDDEYRKKFEYYGFITERVEPKGSSRDYMLKSNQICRDIFLKGKYDIFFSLESDIFPPSDIIERLLMRRKDVIGAPYFTFKGENTVCMVADNDVFFNMAQFNLLKPDKGFMITDGNVKGTSACGLGCLMIKRRVIEKIPFRIDKDQSGHVDSFFHEDLIRNDIKCFIDTSMWVEHRNQDWAAISDNRYN